MPRKPTKRRSPGEGAVYRRAGDRPSPWVAVFTDRDGKKHYRYRRTEREAAATLRELEREHAAMLDLDQPRQTVEQYLRRWLADDIRPIKRYNTWRAYQHAVSLIVPEIGTVRLRDLDHGRVQRMLNEMVRTRTRTLAERARAILGIALNLAERTGAIARNPVAATRLPPVVRRVERAFTATEARIVIEAVANDTYAVGYVLMLGCGLRVGEVLGLRWRDVDLDGGWLHVRYQRTRCGADGLIDFTAPKSQQSARSVPLPRVVIAALQATRRRQVEWRTLAGRAWGGALAVDAAVPSDDDPVVMTPRGTSPRSGTLNKRLARCLRPTNLGHVTPHQLRHAANTLWFERGLAPKTRAALLGHSKTDMTEQVYTHVAPHVVREAADAMDQALKEEEAG